MRARDNPFAVDHLHALAFRGASAATLWERACTTGRGALVGPEGAGKTTLLLELAACARATHTPIWIQLRRDARRLTGEHRAQLASLAAGAAVFVDGADLLPWRDRWWLAHHTRGVPVLGTLHAPGWLPTLVELTTSPALLDELVGELCGRSLAELAIDREALYARHRGNLRTALFELYDLHAHA